MDHYINASEAENPLEDRGLLSDQIRRALADEITTGRLKPGTALDEQQIATRFGAGQSGEAHVFLIQDHNLTAEAPLRRSILQSTLR